jgi:hypothetical protein
MLTEAAVYSTLVDHPYCGYCGEHVPLETLDSTLGCTVPDIEETAAVSHVGSE